MKSKNEIVIGLTLGENFRLIMSKEGLTFKDLSKIAKVPLPTVYRQTVRGNPLLITEQILKIGKALGFTERQMREQVRRYRLEKKRPYSKKQKLFQLLGEILELFDHK